MSSTRGYHARFIRRAVCERAARAERSDGSGRAADRVALEPPCNRQQADELADHRAYRIGQRVDGIRLARGGEQTLRDLDAAVVLVAAGPVSLGGFVSFLRCVA